MSNVAEMLDITNMVEGRISDHSLLKCSINLTTMEDDGLEESDMLSGVSNDIYH